MLLPGLHHGSGDTIIGQYTELTTCILYAILLYESTGMYIGISVFFSPRGRQLENWLKFKPLRIILHSTVESVGKKNNF
jgi:hypothetical protein